MKQSFRNKIFKSMIFGIEFSECMEYVIAETFLNKTHKLLSDMRFFGISVSEICLGKCFRKYIKYVTQKTF